jgi:endoribonuclease Nob1
LDSNQVVVDAGAFYSGIPFLSASRSLFTTKEILAEIKHIKSSSSVIETLIDIGTLSIREPSSAQIEIVRLASGRTGDSVKLSKADLSIIALALELNLPLFTDDYAVANVAATIGLKVQSSKGKGLTETRRWSNYCSACGKSFGTLHTECPLCGNKLRRKYRAKKI